MSILHRIGSMSCVSLGLEGVDNNPEVMVWFADWIVSPELCLPRLNFVLLVVKYLSRYITAQIAETGLRSNSHGSPVGQISPFCGLR